MNIIFNRNYLFSAKDKYYDMNWHSFITWWSKGKIDNKYEKIPINKNKYILSEYPNGTLEVINKENDFQMYSGIWFYINNIKIDLF